MDAKGIMEDTLKNKFDTGRFVRFIKEFFNEAEILSPYKENEKVWSEYKYYIHSYAHIAKYTDSSPKKNNILILAVKLQKGRTVDRARSMQRNFISKLISDTKYDAAIVAFYSEDETTWRLSYVRLDLEFLGGSKVKITLKPAKRYSYLVGKGEPTHTAQERLYPIFEEENFNPTLEMIEEAFSVEAVTKDFFVKYKEKYLKLKEFLDSNDVFIEEADRCQFTSEQFAKKLMGQLAFLYFLQKKGWLGVKVAPHELTEKEFKDIYYRQPKRNKELFTKMYIFTNNGMYRLSKNITELDNLEADIFASCFKEYKFEKENGWGSGTKTFIRDIFNHCTEKVHKNFFDDYLKWLFYDALNKRRGKNQYYNRFNCRIPFLNGGLFDAIEDYDWEHRRFDIPNELFSNVNIKGKEEADGILDIFDRYNFTINEDEPLEKEVAVDPEMLGKIFENLLDVKDRKSKGAFYTPREIVHYICQESLINYLVNKVNVPYDDMRNFILYGELMKDEDCSSASNEENYQQRIPQSVYKNLYEIDKALQNVKVADPAVGSGAFPLGILNEIVKVRINITEYFVKQIPQKYERKMFRKPRHPYKLKWETIQNCIFAVDIESSAVDIAKLRLWLSLVVEQEIDEDNPYPHTLPNLDCNIMCGNSLVDEFEGIKLFDDRLQNNGKKAEISLQTSLFEDQVEDFISELFKEQDRLFGEDDLVKKQDIKSNIDNLIDNIIRIKLSSENNNEGLKKYEEVLKKKSKPYFLWNLEFGKIFKDNGGFDIVIGNPPYVGESGNKDIFRPIANTEFGKKYYIGKMDLFYFFFHKAIDIGNKKAEIAFITTNYYPTAFGGKILRKDFKNRIQIRKLINFNELKIFESALGQHNMITVITKNYDKKVIAETCICNNNGIANSNLINSIVQFQDKQSDIYKLTQSNLFDGTENYIRLNGVNTGEVNSISSVLGKMSILALRLGDIAEVNQGVITGCDYVSGRNIEKLPKDTDVTKNDGIFVFDLKNPRDIFVLNNFKHGQNLLRDFYKNSDISKYWCSMVPTKKLLYYQGKLDMELYQDIAKHLLKFRNILEARLITYNEKYHWTAIHRTREEEIFKKPKIVVPYRTKSNTFAYNDVEWFCRSDVYVITSKNQNYNLQYLLALLNSKPYFIWLYYKGKRKGEILELFQVPLCEIPIMNLNNERQKEYVKVVSEILNITQQENYLKDKNLHKSVIYLRDSIDRMVYKDMKLTEKEILEVENIYRGD